MFVFLIKYKTKKWPNKSKKDNRVTKDNINIPKKNLWKLVGVLGSMSSTLLKSTKEIGKNINKFVDILDLLKKRQ